MSIKRFLIICNMLIVMCLLGACTNMNTTDLDNKQDDSGVVVEAYGSEYEENDTELKVESAEEEPEADKDMTMDTEDTLPMEVHYIDVGEADSVLIKCGDEAMLVDAGNPDQGTKIRLYLKKNNVSQLKYLILTHPDRDHIGGAASVISNVKMDNLFMCGYEKESNVYSNVMNEINYKNMTWSTPEVGSEYPLGDAIITIIAPNREYDNPNDSSIAFIVSHGANSFIFTGDAESAAEADIVSNGMDISADVYYVGHHGSSTSSTQEFLDKVNPGYAVISCARDNEYGHPHIETMEKLKAMGTKLFRTDDQGTIICYSDGIELVFNVEPSDNWSNGNAYTAESPSEPGIDDVLQEDSTDENVEDVSNEITYVLNTNTKKFHYPWCSSVNEMKPKNRKDVTMERNEIIGRGYKACKRCNP